jgi:2-dehydropantoate 2-reductase
MESKILVAGAGPIGLTFGCLLKKAGHDITLLGRPWHLEAIATRGLELDGLWGTHHAEGFKLATQAGELAGPYDLILIAVKAYDTREMVEEVASRLAPNGLAISLQNGLGNIETLAERFGPGRSLGASILVGAKIGEPGKATVTVQAAPVIIGPLDPAATGAMERTRHIAELFNEARIPCEPTDQILSHLWAKVFYNAPLNPLGALLHVHYGVLGERGELRAMMDEIVEEAFEVARRKGVRLLWNSADAYLELFYGKLVPATYNHQSSMLQDLEKGRRTEIDAINGKIWGYGRELGFPTPYNETMTRLIRAREQRSKDR